MKTHLRHIFFNTKLTFEEFTTIMIQIEAVLNSGPLAPMPCNDNGIEPGHFVVGKPLEALPLSLLLLCITASSLASDGLVRVVQVKTSSGTYRRPISKIVLLLSQFLHHLHYNFNHP